MLQSGTRGCCRDAMALESTARDHLETTGALKSAAQACSRAAKPRKSMAQACITARKPARSSFVAALRSKVQLDICALCFCVRPVFVSVSLFPFAVVFAFACGFSVMSNEAAFQKYSSKVLHEIAARKYYSKSQVYVALGSINPHSALLCYVHGYARVHTSLY